MENSLKKYILLLLEVLTVLLVRGSYRLYKTVFAKRTLLFVTKQKIRSITLGPVSQLLFILAAFWVGDIFLQSLKYDKIVNAKTEEIDRLRTVNSYFETEFGDVNEKLSKVSEYLNSITGGGKRPVKLNEHDLKQPNIEDKNLSKDDKKTLNQLKSIDNHLIDIHSVVQVRIKKIESAISITGLNIKKTFLSYTRERRFYSKSEEIATNRNYNSFSGQGGPALDEALPSSKATNDNIEQHLKKVKFTGEIDYLITLENLLNIMPFSKPMKNYYISSGFGRRVDPIHRGAAMHRGLDFVGVANEKIISPSNGVVTLAGRFSDYGNAIVIDHGFGITTRYGHLREVKVKEGQTVKRGDVIAVQGSTGRSTGPHLHYEIRYKNIPLNPRKFLQAGDYMFNRENGIGHVNS